MELTIIILMILAGMIYFSLIIANKLNIEDKEAEYKINISNFFALITVFAFYSSQLLDFIEIKIENELLSIVLLLYFGSIVFIVITYIPILFLVKKNPKLSLKIFKPFSFIAKILFYPITFVFNFLKNLVSPKVDEQMSEGEFLEIIDIAEEHDGITKNESKLIKNVLRFHDLKVTDIFTPRIDVIAVDKTTKPEEILDIFIKSGYSRLPVYDEDIDNVIGIINYKDLYGKVIYKNEPINKILQNPVEITEYMEIADLLSLLKLNKAHMAIVKDEFGGTIGIVTMEDILEELVGDIWDEHDIVLENIKPLNGNRYLVLGQTYLDDFTETLDLEEIEDEDNSTINGWVLSNLGKMAVKGDKFTYNNLEVVVTKVSDKQVLEVEIKVLEQ